MKDFNVVYHYFCKDEDYSYHDTDWIHESSKRKRMEELIFRNPRTELQNVKSMISTWRNHDINIVFGNLGRQPYLLNYYLDMCFGPEENIRITCRWKLPSHYQTDAENLDFLFLVEPFFGYTIQKPSSVKHLIVLTSHLSLYYAKDPTFHFLHLSSNKNQHLPSCSLEEGKLFYPPIFHENFDIPVPRGAVLLDVTKSKSANEAYLRLLTGKEIIQKRPFKIVMNDRDRVILQTHLLITRRQAKKMWDIPWLENIYWII